MARVPDGALRLVFVTPGDRGAARTAGLVAEAVAGGASCVLVREPERETARAAAAAARAGDAFVVVARDLELALELGADGVHGGHFGPRVADARARAPGLVVSRSAHWPLTDEDRAADWITLSPFAPTPKSHPRPLLEPAQVRAALATPGLGPVVALGGLDADAVAALPDGLAGVAVLRAIADAPAPRAAAAALREALSGHAVP